MPQSAVQLDDADVRYIAGFLSADEGNHYHAELMDEIAWQQPEITLFGKTVMSPRLAAWYGDVDAVYVYSGLVNRPLPWTTTLSMLRHLVERKTGSRFNSVLLNLYRDGDDAMGWHADDEPELDVDPVIASLSLGGPRNLLLRRKKKPRPPSTRIRMEHASLLIMQGTTQRYWQHNVPRTKKPVGARINLTFRQVKGV